MTHRGGETTVARRNMQAQPATNDPRRAAQLQEAWTRHAAPRHPTGSGHQPVAPCPRPSVSAWLERLRRGLRTLGWLAAAAPFVAQAQGGAPAHWIGYAELVSAELQQRLSDPADEAVQRLHGWMQERLLRSDAPVPQALVARLWISAQGRIERLEATPLGSVQADDALRQLLTAKPLQAPTPADMRQPLVLQFDLRVLEPGVAAAVPQGAMP